MLSKSIEQLKQPGSHLEEAEEELHGDHSMQEEQAPASGASVRAESSSAGVDDRIGQQVESHSQCDGCEQTWHSGLQCPDCYRCLGLMGRVWLQGQAHC